MNTDWRESIYRRFAQPRPRLVIAGDRDGLLRDPRIMDFLRESGYRWVAYEGTRDFLLRWREELAPGLESGPARLVVDIGDEQFFRLPSEIAEHPAAEKFEFNLGDLFPKLSLNVVAQMDREDIDALYAIQDQYKGADSDDQSCDFILRYIYKINWQAVTDRAELYRALLPFHYRRRLLPPVFIAYLARQLSLQYRLHTIPIGDLFASRSYFYQYLQSEWDEYLSALQKDSFEIKDGAKSSFDEPDIKAFLDNLFSEGILQRVSVHHIDAIPGWARFGVLSSDDLNQEDQACALMRKIRESSGGEMSYRGWMALAADLGELIHVNTRLILQGNRARDTEVHSLENQIDGEFTGWLMRHFSGLCTLPYLPRPVAGHHIAPWIEAQKNPRSAIIIMDGMSFAAWSHIERMLPEHFNRQTQAVFAWVPTLTGIARQAVFSGRMPMNFSAGWNTTSGEEKMFIQFWNDHGYKTVFLQYQRGLGFNTEAIDGIPLGRHVRVCGLVVGVVDELAHNALQGLPDVWNGLKLWMDGNFLSRILSKLLDSGYTVYITSDHGQRQCRGVGRINEGSLAEMKGERTRIFGSDILRRRYLNDDQSIGWDVPGLPEGLYPMFARGDGAYLTEGELGVCHGGISLMEVVVPLICITRKETA